MFAIPAKQKKQSLKTLSSKSSSYPTDDISLKEMPYNPKLIPMGFEEEEAGNDEDTEFEEEEISS